MKKTGGYLKKALESKGKKKDSKSSGKKMKPKASGGKRWAY